MKKENNEFFELFHVLKHHINQ